MDWQTMVALGIVAACAWFVGIRIFGLFRGRGSGGCGCGHCPGEGVADGKSGSQESRR